MLDPTARTPWKKRFLIVGTCCFVFVILFLVAVRITVNEIFRGIESSRSTGLAAVDWDVSRMWTPPSDLAQISLSANRGSWVARTADLQSRTSTFDQAVTSLHKIVDVRHGYFEELHTQSSSGRGRILAAGIAVPSDEFDITLSELRGLGRVISASQAGEDSAVRIENSARRLSATQTNLSRLQKLQRERKGELRDAVALEKDIAQANDAVAEALREQERLKSTVVLSHIRLALLEDYRAPLQIGMADSALQLRNALVTGIAAIFYSFSLVLGVALNYGLPLLFWLVLLFFPLRAIRRRFLRTPIAQPGI